MRSALPPVLNECGSPRRFPRCAAQRPRTWLTAVRAPPGRLGTARPAVMLDRNVVAAALVQKATMVCATTSVDDVGLVANVTELVSVATELSA